MTPLKVFIADDEAPARERLKELLGDLAAQLPTEITGEARNGIEALDAVPKSGARVLLLDIQMPGLSGLDLLRACPPASSSRPRWCSSRRTTATRCRRSN